MNNRAQVSSNSRVGSWLSPTRDLKLASDLNPNQNYTSFSYRSIQSPSPRAEILGQVRESIISQIKNQNICLENKIKLREQLHISKDIQSSKLFNTSNIKEIQSTKHNYIYSQSRSPANSRFRFDFAEKSMKKTVDIPKNNRNNEEIRQLEQLDEVYAKVKEMVDEHKNMEKTWKNEKTQMEVKIQNLEKKIREMEKGL